MGYAGKLLLPREVLGYHHDQGWRDKDLIEMGATSLGEGSGSVGSWHDNPKAGPGETSKDCGLDQINVLVSQIGTPVEFALRTESLDQAVWEPVVRNNIKAAWDLWHEPMIGRHGEPRLRRLEPWVAWTSGWAPFPEWWVWHQDNGVPVGPWLPTGRFMQKSIAGLANYHILIAQDYTPDVALAQAQKFAAAFKVPGTLGYDVSLNLVKWTHVPPMPAAPPADGIGPRPVPNDGR